jgi:multidrug resistance efflux pump
MKKRIIWIGAVALLVGAAAIWYFKPFSKATVDQAQAELEYQPANNERYKALYDKQLIAKTDFDQATYNYHKAQASLNSAVSS